jgi:deoxycytidylate deaminase
MSIPVFVLFQVGAILANRDKQIVGVGYNGMPLHIPDGQPEQKEQELSE